jgi:hypothetical protein
MLNRMSCRKGKGGAATGGPRIFIFTLSKILAERVSIAVKL